MKSKRMKSILLIGLAMFLVAGVIWGSFSAVSASAAARTRKAAEQQARTANDAGDVAKPEVPSKNENAPKAEGAETQKRNRVGNGESTEKGNPDAIGTKKRARDGNGGEDCDGTCPNCETREARRAENRAESEKRARDGSCGEDCDGTCPNYETREARREQNRGKNRNGK